MLLFIISFNKLKCKRFILSVTTLSPLPRRIFGSLLRMNRTDCSIKCPIAPIFITLPYMLHCPVRHKHPLMRRCPRPRRHRKSLRRNTLGGRRLIVRCPAFIEPSCSTRQVLSLNMLSILSAETLSVESLPGRWRSRFRHWWLQRYHTAASSTSELASDSAVPSSSRNLMA